MADRQKEHEEEIMAEIKAPHRDAGEAIREYLLESKQHEETEKKDEAA